MLWRLTRPGEGLDQFFVHWLNDTVIRLPRRLFRHPGARPWLGDFPIQVQRIGSATRHSRGSAIRQQEFQGRLRAWPQMLQALVIATHYTH
jgi:hypothetical protein